MNCNEVKNVLPFLGDGSLDVDIEHAAHAHLNECMECKKDYEETVRMLGTIQDVLSQPTGSSSDDFLAAVHHKINKKKRLYTITYRVLPVAAVFVAALTISFYSLLLRNNSGSGRNMVEKYQLDSEYSSYVADRYFDVYEMYELAEQDYPDEMYDAYGDLIENGYVDLYYSEIVDSIDEETAMQLLSQ